MVTQVDGGRGEPRCLAAHLANAMGSVQQVRPRTRVCPGCAIVICRACAGLWFALLCVAVLCAHDVREGRIMRESELDQYQTQSQYFSPRTPHVCALRPSRVLLRYFRARPAPHCKKIRFVTKSVTNERFVSSYEADNKRVYLPN